jgi:hypothetical protein
MGPGGGGCGVWDSWFLGRRRRRRGWGSDEVTERTKELGLFGDLEIWVFSKRISMEEQKSPPTWMVMGIERGLHLCLYFSHGMQFWH